jgi:uncharacterized membrane protein YhaH (DUF805 family)
MRVPPAAARAPVACGSNCAVASIGWTRSRKHIVKGDDMGEFSAFHWIIVLVVLIIFIFPIVKILQKAGYSGWWVLFWFIPIGNIVALWIFAFADWPALRGSVRPNP